VAAERVSCHSSGQLIIANSRIRSFDGKTKVWGMETRGCVATHGESDKPVWSVKWLPKLGRSETFAVAGANRSISLFREASGG